MLPAKGERIKHTGAELPQILGHEISGRITEVGQDVQGFEIGQRVAVNAAVDDRHHSQQPCEFCKVGRHNICASIAFYGINSTSGGLADEMIVKPYALVTLPDNVPLMLAALAEPLAVAAHMVRISGFRKGQDVVVFGAGPIGSALTFLLKDSGARTIVVSEMAASRAAQAKECGADRVVNPTEEDVVEVVQSLMGHGADVCFEACGLQATLDAAISCTKPGGIIFNVAIHEKPVTVDMNRLTLPEKRLMAGNAYTSEDFDRVLRVLSTRAADIEKFISAVVPLERAVDEGFSELVNNKAKHNKILIEVGGEQVDTSVSGQ